MISYKEIKSYLKRSSVNGVVPPSTATQIVYANGYKLLDFSLVFNSQFKTDGIFKILINDKEFISVNATDLTDLTEFNLNLVSKYLELEDFKSIQLFAWTSSGVASAITLSVTLGR